MVVVGVVQAGASGRGSQGIYGVVDVEVELELSWLGGAWLRLAVVVMRGSTSCVMSHDKKLPSLTHPFSIE